MSVGDGIWIFRLGFDLVVNKVIKVMNSGSMSAQLFMINEMAIYGVTDQATNSVNLFITDIETLNH